MSLQGWGEFGSLNYVLCFVLCFLVSVTLIEFSGFTVLGLERVFELPGYCCLCWGDACPALPCWLPNSPAVRGSSSSWKANRINTLSAARQKWQNFSPRFTEKDKRRADTGMLYRETLNTGLLDPSVVPLYLNCCISLPLFYRWHFWTVALCRCFRIQYHVALLPSADREVRISSAW